MPGVTACVNGMVVCEGEVLPMPNLCDGISRDCTGIPNINGNCPAGSTCYMGNCVTPCGNSEFPCPGGYVCLRPQNLCVPDACQKKNCPATDICRVADDGTASCIDPCAMVTCQKGYTCQSGVCINVTCAMQGCPDGQICLGAGPACQPDPCAGVHCAASKFCNADGKCEQTCATSCPFGQVCVDGACVADPCMGKTCLTNQVCAVSGGAGSCVPNLCQASCNPGLICCGGQCRHDPCAGLDCGTNGHCVVDGACNAGCQSGAPPNQDKIVGSGGGGFACEVGGPTRPPPLLWALFALVICARWRRPGARRRSAR
jgi:hypothetical protein